MTDRSDIRALDDDTVKRIAAGEVVERPASVVKELVENSLDADASRVSVAVESGGTNGVRIRDDGAGMDAADLARAVEEHTTSKIRDVDDLEAGVGTLGFRGEALHTIGAVSRLTVRSKPRGAAGAGHEISVEGGEVGDVEPVGCPEGTVVEVEDLFFNTPARRKFLKTDATEFDHVNTVVMQYALANPDVAVSLEHDGREVFATEGRGDLRSAVLSVYGREVAESMIEVDASPGRDDGATASGDTSAARDAASGDTSAARDAASGDTSAARDAASGNPAPIERVHGLVSHPETTRSNRDYLATFVNDRYVTAAVLREAVVDAYGGQLAPDRYPFAVLFVEVPTETVDVNVHPRKMEVRFDEESAVKTAVRDAVETAIVDHGLIRSTAPRGRSAPDEAAVTPEESDEEIVGGAGTTHEAESGAAERRSRRDRSRTTADSTDADSRDDSVAAVRGDTADSDARGDIRDTDSGDDITPATEVDPDSEDAWIVTDAAGGADDPTDSVETHSDIGPSLDAGTESADARDDAGGAAPGRDASDAAPGHVDVHTEAKRPSPREWQSDVGAEDGGEPATDDASSAGDGPSRDATPRGGVRAPTSQRTLAGGETAAERDFESLPPLRLLGQFDDTYVVAEAPDGLVLIDQHAADERVNYERLRDAFAGGMAAQALADPVEIELTAREAALFDECGDELSELGFRAERTGDRTVVVSAVPTVFDAALEPDLLRDVLAAVVSDDDEGAREVADVADELLADLACYPSVTGNTSLTEGSVVDLLEALDDCENPYACPHGRPVVIAFDRDDIEDRFERDYPGHAGRRAE